MNQPDCLTTNTGLSATKHPDELHRGRWRMMAFLGRHRRLLTIAGWLKWKPREATCRIFGHRWKDYQYYSLRWRKCPRCLKTARVAGFTPSPYDYLIAHTHETQVKRGMRTSIYPPVH